MKSDRNLSLYLAPELVATLNDEERSALSNLIAPAVIMLNDESQAVRSAATWVITTLEYHLRARVALDAALRWAP